MRRTLISAALALCLAALATFLPLTAPSGGSIPRQSFATVCPEPQGPIDVTWGG